jgi:GNAT superfamily N-acetyltransferase
MDIRPATAADAPALAPLMAELGYPTTPEEMAARLEILQGRADFATLVAEVDGAIAGMVGVTVSPSLYRSDLLGAIVALVVSSGFRGRGIAARLVDRGEQWLRDAGAPRATVNPSTHREDAHRLYARLGYEATGVRFSKPLG